MRMSSRDIWVLGFLEVIWALPAPFHAPVSLGSAFGGSVVSCLAGCSALVVEVGSGWTNESAVRALGWVGDEYDDRKMKRSVRTAAEMTRARRKVNILTRCGPVAERDRQGSKRPGVSRGFLGGG